ncbi:MAG TPA: helix-turn-helix transcriptional regulator [Melioribacteraceae bacterium]|nr:helix-turn-helix transcriptional regulator [Melioribacteraceae bacterium]
MPAQFSIINSIGYIVIIFSLPELTTKYKVGFVLFLIFYLLIDISSLSSLIAMIFSVLFILIYFANNIIHEIRLDGKISLFFIPLFSTYLVLIVTTFASYTTSIPSDNIFYARIILIILINILLTLYGPDRKINFTFGYNPELKKKSLHNIDLSREEYNLYLDRGFSDREIQIFQLLRAGFSNNEIARKLGIGKKTVESHLRNLRSKLKIKSLTELRDTLKDREKIADSF